MNRIRAKQDFREPVGFTAPVSPYAVGQIIEHKLLGFRGVIFDIDPVFMLSDEWYERTASSRPSQDQPWYHVLVHNGVQSAYVAQQNLSEASCNEQINHPALGEYFTSFDGQQYATYENL